MQVQILWLGKAIIGYSDVTFNINPNIKIKNGNGQKTYNQFTTKIDVKLKQAIEIMKTVAQEYKTNKWFNIYEYLNDQPFEVRILSYKDNNILIYLIDKEDTIKGKPYLFRFALL